MLVNDCDMDNFGMHRVINSVEMLDLEVIEILTMQVK